jgi:hypothetical protein
MFTAHIKNNNSCRKEYLDSYGTHTIEQLIKTKEIIRNGLELFEKLWNYNAKSFIGTCYIWHPKVEEYLNELNIKHIQSGRVQKIPNMRAYSYKIRRLYTGKKNKLGQFYTVRNVSFEPSEDPYKNCIDTTIKEIETAFRWHKPAIICSHRVNYIGFINPENQINNLKLLKKLLNKILKLWPDVTFMNSAQLGNLITVSNSKFQC